MDFKLIKYFEPFDKRSNIYKNHLISREIYMNKEYTNNAY